MLSGEDHLLGKHPPIKPGVAMHVPVTPVLQRVEAGAFLRLADHQPSSSSSVTSDREKWDI